MRVLALVLAVLHCCCGCGTVANYIVGNPPKTYGGVDFDLDQANKLVTGDTSPLDQGLGSSSDSGAILAIAFVALIVVWPFLDLPLSAVGDTVTYPLTKWIESPSP